MEAACATIVIACLTEKKKPKRKKKAEDLDEGMVEEEE